jgi:hypothetical protein
MTNWRIVPTSIAWAMMPPRSAPATPAPTVASKLIDCLPGRRSRASAPRARPINAHDKKLEWETDDDPAEEEKQDYREPDDYQASLGLPSP